MTENISRNKGFLAFFSAQFFGALNDNIFKNALIVLIAYKGVTLWGLDYKSVVALASGIFILPFVLFSPISGQLSDKFEKSKITKIVKYAEVAIMAIASFGFYSHNFDLLMVALFLMGVHSTFFGPAKYAIIPELLPEKQLTAGNAYVEVGTFLAILIGTILGGLAAGAGEQAEEVITASLIVVAILGVISSHLMPDTPAANPELVIQKNPIKQFLTITRLTIPNKAVFNSVLGISWFWFFGAGLLSILPVLTKDLLFSSEQVVTLFLATFTVGIAVGAIVAEKLSFERVEIGLVPWASLGMTIFLLDLALAANNWGIKQQLDHLLIAKEFISEPGAYRILFDLFLVSVFGGVFTVPLYTLIQERSEKKIRSQIVAANNILNSFFMVISSLLLMSLYALNFTVPEIIVVYSLLNLLISIYIYAVVPEFTLRFLSWMLARCIYRINVSGIKNIPENGPAVIVCNHVSFIDWLIIAAAIQRPVRFVMYYKFFKIPLLRYLFKHAKVIPIAGANEDSNLFNQAFARVSKELRDGEIVCIFPEGQLTRNGELNAFKKGIEHIIATNPVPVIPVALSGLWGSVFSHKDGKAFTKVPRRAWFRVLINIGQPVPAAEAKATHLEHQVRSLLGNLS